MTKTTQTPAIGSGLVLRLHALAGACDNRVPSALTPPPSLSLWIYTMNRCTLAPRGRAFTLLGQGFTICVNAVNAVEAA